MKPKEHSKQPKGLFKSIGQGMETTRLVMEATKIIMTTLNELKASAKMQETLQVTAVLVLGDCNANVLHVEFSQY